MAAGSPRILLVGEAPSTCWTVIRGAAEGGNEEREEFARRYLSAVRAYLLARWKGSGLIQETDDAVQEVFVECFRSALSRAAGRNAGFRGYLYGVVRNVARRFEERRACRREAQAPDSDAVAAFPANEPALSEVFDRAWAGSLLDRACARHAENARRAGPDAERRVELLALRFQEDLPIREIAARWERDPAELHREYAKARREFQAALLEVVSFDHPGTPAEIRRECAHLVSFFR
jgi:RNA polymerase sigma-70 factor (ECF subfamily)